MQIMGTGIMEAMGITDLGFTGMEIMDMEIQLLVPHTDTIPHPSMAGIMDTTTPHPLHRRTAPLVITDIGTQFLDPRTNLGIADIMDAPHPLLLQLSQPIGQQNRQQQLQVAITDTVLRLHHLASMANTVACIVQLLIQQLNQRIGQRRDHQLPIHAITATVLQSDQRTRPHVNMASTAVSIVQQPLPVPLMTVVVENAIRPSHVVNKMSGLGTELSISAFLTELSSKSSKKFWASYM